MLKPPNYILTAKHNWLPVSKVPHLWVRPTVDWKYFTKRYIVSDMDHVAKPKMVSNVGKMYTLIFLVIIQWIKYNSYLQSIYIALGIVRNLQLTWSIWQDVCRLYSSPILYKGLKHLKIWVLVILEPVLRGYWGWLHLKTKSTSFLKETACRGPKEELFFF